MRRYSSRSGLSFGRSDELTRIRQGIVIIFLSIALAALVLSYFLMIRPGSTTNESLRQRYMESMQSELKQASDSITKMSRTGGWGSYRPAATVRSNLYALRVLYRLYTDCGGPEIGNFSELDEVIEMTDEYVTAIQNGGTSTANTVTDIQNRVENLMNALRSPQAAGE